MLFPINSTVGSFHEGWTGRMRRLGQGREPTLLQLHELHECLQFTLCSSRRPPHDIQSYQTRVKNALNLMLPRLYARGPLVVKSGAFSDSLISPVLVLPCRPMQCTTSGGYSVNHEDTVKALWYFILVSVDRVLRQSHIPVVVYSECGESAFGLPHNASGCRNNHELEVVVRSKYSHVLLSARPA
jgi:hypothetical protein